MNKAEKIKEKAFELGFDLAGVTTSEPMCEDEIQIFKKWLDKGYAGQMDYMRRNLDKRTNPAKLLDNAKSVIVAGINYNLPEINIKSPATGRIARYAQFQDYHIFIKNMLKQLAEFICEEIDSSTKFKICVDSVPLAERALAVRAGLGFIGKNHMLINPEYGIEIFLGEIITTAEIEIDRPFDCKCTGCDKCIRECPTGAIGRDGWLDASKCISYLTIEYKGEIEVEYAKKIGDCVFGCDRCVFVCPYYKNSPQSKNENIKSQYYELEINEILKMSQKGFETKFSDSPIFRTGLNNLKRNARICLENINKK